MPAKPTKLPDWATSGTGIANTTEPSSGKKGDGWAPAEKPAAQYFNWWFNNVGTWIDYLAGAQERLEWARLLNAEKKTSAASILAFALTGIAYDGALRLVVIGSSAAGTAALATSDDGGLSWTSRTHNLGGGNDGLDVAWNGSLFVATGKNGAISTSPDGTTWTARTSGVATDLQQITWSPTNSLWAVAQSNGKVLTSPDGTTWTDRTTGLGNVGSAGVVWGAGPGLFVATAPTATTTTALATSPDGTTWTTRTLAENGAQRPGYAPYDAGARFVIVSNANKLYTSPDGITWTARFGSAAIFSGGVLNGWIWTGAIMAAFNSGNKVPLVASIDGGVTWAKYPLPWDNTTDAVAAAVQAFGGIVLGGTAAVIYQTFRAPVV